jgi:Rieske Fe-S protein
LKDCNEIVDCSGRREFLVKAAFMAGGLALTLSGISSAFGAAFEDVIVPIDERSPLNKVGGSAVVDSAAGKIMIVRTGETAFVAFSAKCTHKGGTVAYNAEKKQFACPKHGSTFDSATGKQTSGPAEAPLPAYGAKGSGTSVTVTVGT